MTKATGWSVVADGARIYVKTVSETRRAAIVNWLVTEREVAITAWHTDEAIEKMWKHYGQYVDCREVEITTVVPSRDRA